jgi:hypothetical protein
MMKTWRRRVKIDLCGEKWFMLVVRGLKRGENFEHCIVKRALREQGTSNIPDTIQSEHVCNIWSRLVCQKLVLSVIFDLMAGHGKILNIWYSALFLFCHVFQYIFTWRLWLGTRDFSEQIYFRFSNLLPLPHLLVVFTSASSSFSCIGLSSSCIGLCYDIDV